MSILDPNQDANPPSAIQQLFASLCAREIRALARAVSLVEDGAPEAASLLALCRDALHGQTRAFRVGITGPAGAGKSTLVDALTRELRGQGRRVGIVAVDPSSPFSGGAILGDRIRLTDLSGDSGVYMRSMATRGHLGGLAAATSDVLTVIEAAGFDWLLIETTGVGQGEIEVVRLADAVAVVLVPGMGDSIQSLKAGVLEIASVFVLNKADRDGVDRLEAEIGEMLALSAVVSAGKAAPPVLKTTATTSAGVAELLVTLDLLAAQVAGVEARVDFHGVRGTTEQLAEKGVSEGFVTGHDFSRAAKANRIKGALAPEGSWLRQISEIASSSASWEVVPLHKATATPVESAVLDHLGVAVRSIDASLGLYRALGVFVSGIEEVPHERVRVAMLQTGDSRIELLEATEPESAVGRFLAKRGEGLHHVAMRVPDLAAAVERLKALNVRLVSEAIQIGAGGHRYVFVHPSSANGVLLELVEAAVTGESN